MSLTVQNIFQPTSFGELVRWAEFIQQSDLLPRDYRGKPSNIVLACQMGSEVGLSPMQALAGIAVINGRPGIWGDALIGLCRQSPLCEDIQETVEGDGDARVAVCTAKRKGATVVVARFSVGDAKRAGLASKDIWKAYPDRMLRMRARGFALRDAFPDILRGLKTAEELQDYPTIEGRAEEPAPVPAEKPTRGIAGNTEEARAAKAAQPDEKPTREKVDGRTKEARAAKAQPAEKAPAEILQDLRPEPWTTTRTSQSQDGFTVTEQAAATPLFEAFLFDANGEPTDGEIHTDATAWVMKFLALWQAASVDARLALEEHNADALAAARRLVAFELKGEKAAASAPNGSDTPSDYDPKD